MTIRNMLPSRTVSAERRAAVETELRKALLAESASTAREHIRGRRRTAIVVIASVVGVAGAGTATAAALGVFGGGHVVYAGYGKSYPISATFQVTISPSSGPAGTVVTIHATGCFDPSGGNHVVSYNDGIVGATSAENLARIHAIPVTMTGTTYTGRFSIPPNAAATGEFYEQCGASSASQRFTVTP